MRNSGDRKQPLFMISVVCRMLDVHPQTLRLYEREGFITPYRTNRTRLYSLEDVERLGMILQLTRELGVNRAGVDIIIRLKKRVELLQKEMDEMMQLLDEGIRENFRHKLMRLFLED